MLLGRKRFCISCFPTVSSLQQPSALLLEVLLVGNEEQPTKRKPILFLPPFPLLSLHLSLLPVCFAKSFWAPEGSPAEEREKGWIFSDIIMVWSPQSAANAYLDTVKLCKNVNERKHKPCSPIEPESTQFLSALAAGMSAQHIVEVSPQASQSTVALAVAARQTGGRLICILLQSESLVESRQVIEDSGLTDIVEFKVGDPYKLLPECENVDFSVVDCKTEAYTGLLKLLDMNPRKSVVVANNLVGEKPGLGGELQSLPAKSAVRSAKHPIGKGMEVTMIGKSTEFGIEDSKSFKEERKAQVAARRLARSKSTWVRKVDEVSGEEHLFRLPMSL